MYHNHHYPVHVGTLIIGFISCWPSTPWEVMDPDVGEIWPFATYAEAHAFAKARI